MKAITLRPWWAWAVVAGGKLVENRSVDYKHRGPIFIHASVARNRGAEADLKAILSRVAIPEFEDLDRGAIIARAEVIGVVGRDGESYFNCQTKRRELLPQSQRKWLSPKYRFGLVLANIVPLYPVPMRGHLVSGRPATFELGSDIAAPQPVFSPNAFCGSCPERPGAEMRGPGDRLR
jgi:hypothetical protein